ncbi:unnamed protein product [Pleuronectes platessa]|uniref:Uncharacterized protein n=1 Tax=Pleuronectes platessa TaxID=8262 RepID=A0A9N7YEQ5_PLEPL|nr:unnamed protein product [Pleuronectes platessa]
MLGGVGALCDGYGAGRPVQERLVRTLHEEGHPQTIRHYEKIKRGDGFSPFFLLTPLPLYLSHPLAPSRSVCFLKVGKTGSRRRGGGNIPAKSCGSGIYTAKVTSNCKCEDLLVESIMYELKAG